jgi:hypothetical protein
MCAAACRVRSGTNKDLKSAEKVLPILPEKISANQLWASTLAVTRTSL